LSIIESVLIFIRYLKSKDANLILLLFTRERERNHYRISRNCILYILYNPCVMCIMHVHTKLYLWMWIRDMSLKSKYTWDHYIAFVDGRCTFFALYILLLSLLLYGSLSIDMYMYLYVIYKQFSVMMMI